MNSKEIDRALTDKVFDVRAAAGNAINIIYCC
jgi:hypothetical protein